MLERLLAAIEKEKRLQAERNREANEGDGDGVPALGKAMEPAGDGERGSGA